MVRRDANGDALGGLGFDTGADRDRHLGVYSGTLASGGEAGPHAGEGEDALRQVEVIDEFGGAFDDEGAQLVVCKPGFENDGDARVALDVQ